LRWDLNQKNYRVCQTREWWETEGQRKGWRTHRKGNVICLSTKVTGTVYPYVIPYRKHGIIGTGQDSLAKKKKKSQQ